MNNLTENRSKALVITGKEASGKSSLARAIANDNGTWTIINYSKFKSIFGLGEVLDYEHDTLIIDEFNGELEELKPLIGNEEVEIRRRGKHNKMVKVPDIIICTTREFYDRSVEYRRFKFINIKS